MQKINNLSLINNFSGEVASEFFYSGKDDLKKSIGTEFHERRTHARTHARTNGRTNKRRQGNGFELLRMCDMAR